MTDTRALAEEIAGGHYECDDSWYSCPLSPDGCADSRQEGCTCGRDSLVQKIDAALADERRKVWEEAYEYVKQHHFNVVTSKHATKTCVVLEDYFRAQAQAGPEEGA